MTINQINNNYSDKEIKKSHRSDTPDAQQADSVSKAQNQSPSDNFILSGSKFEDDLDFARNELKKLGADSFSALRKIKSKINRGEYSNEEVHKKISSLVEKDLSSIETIIDAAPEPAESIQKGKKLTKEYKSYLIENPEVTKKVSDQIAQDLKKL